MKRYNIIVPAYNSEKTIGATVEALETSGLSDFRILIVNDGSSDNTEMVCRKLMTKYANISYYWQNNRGVSAARNYGIAHADGEYLLFFDADDHVERDAYRHADNIIQVQQPDMLIYGMSFDYYHNGKLFRSEELVYPEEACYSADEVQQNFSRLYQANALTSSCNKFIKRSIVQENRLDYPQNMFLLEDLLFSLDVIERCDRVYVLPEAIYHYHQAEGNGNVYHRIQRIDSLTEFVQPFAQRLKKHPDIYSRVYYMLLNQKLWRSNLQSIRETAQDHKKMYIAPFTELDRLLDNNLRMGHYYRIRCRNLMLQFRHIVADCVKKTSIYQYLKRKEDEHE